MGCRIARLNNKVVAIALSVFALANAGPSPWPAITLLATGLSARDSREDDPPRRPCDVAAAERRALEAAKRLIRGMVRYPIVLVDPELSPDPDAIRRVDAFIVAEPDGRLRPKIYVNRESALFQRAANGDDFSVKVLAAVLVHEMAHLMGQQEAGARMAEQRFVSDLIAHGIIPEGDGLRYLTQLRQRAIEAGLRPAR